jgi:2-oxoglutarate ferredoxin oxidoreductase subunit alpha
MNEAIGAAYAGVRSMVGTAGGGFALMVEAVSLAAVTEIPIVAVVGGRPGPATGLPTWSSQTDLQFVLHAGHGEFPRFVFTPGDAQECFDLTRLAFALTEKYHTQAYLVVDRYLLESRLTAKAIGAQYNNERYSLAKDPLPEDNSYRRFVPTPEGYSPRSIPGQAHGLSLTNSYEHDEYGWATEDAAMAKTMTEKRLRKLTGMSHEVPLPVLMGPREAKTTLICWGGTKLVVSEVIKLMNAAEPGSVNCIHLTVFSPFPTTAFLDLVKDSQMVIMIESNAMHQAASIIRAETGYEIKHHINRYDGRPFYATEVITRIKEIVGSISELKGSV